MFSRIFFTAGLAIALGLGITGCDHPQMPKDSVTMLIESSPTSLDPRIGTDAQAERIDSLLFDSLVHRNSHFGLSPSLATSWDIPDPLTYVFHLRSGVYFQDGRPLTSKDVKWTIDSILQDKVITVKAGSYDSVDHIDAPDPQTVIFHLKRPDPALLSNLADAAIGIVPYGSGRDFWKHPIGSGPFEFVSQQQDKDVVIKRSPNYWGTPPHIARVYFAVVPDATTRALELQKGSADIAINALSPDMTRALQRNPKLQVEIGPGTELNYIVFNLRDPILRDLRVREAIASAINRPLIIQSLFRGHARLAESLLPPEHWAWTGDVEQHPYNPAEANALLDAAGYKRDKHGVRFHITMKTSTDETTRLLSMVIQQELSKVGIALDLRSSEFAAFYADLTRGAFQMAPSRWIGGNESPDIFEYAYSTARFPPHGGNRGYYSNPEVDALLARAASATKQAERAAYYRQVQKLLAHDMPTLDLWYLDTVVVHDRRLGHLRLSPSGNFDFLRTATLQK